MLSRWCGHPGGGGARVQMRQPKVPLPAGEFVTYTIILSFVTTALYCHVPDDGHVCLSSTL